MRKSDMSPIQDLIEPLENQRIFDACVFGAGV